jgi:hypothetical protein
LRCDRREYHANNIRSTKLQELMVAMEYDNFTFIFSERSSSLETHGSMVTNDICRTNFQELMVAKECYNFTLIPFFSERPTSLETHGSIIYNANSISYNIFMIWKKTKEKKKPSS